MYKENYGKWDPKFSRDIYGMNNLPYLFSIGRFRNLEDYQIGWWNETHTKVIIIFFSLKKTCVLQFYRGSDGNVIDLRDESNGNANEEPFIITMKFPSEVHISLGFSAVKNIVDGEMQEK